MPEIAGLRTDTFHNRVDQRPATLGDLSEYVLEHTGGTNVLFDYVNGCLTDRLARQTMIDKHHSS